MEAGTAEQPARCALSRNPKDFVLALDSAKPAHREADPAAGDRWARRIFQTVAYMREHLNQSLQVTTLAGLANVSASHYFALFKRHVGCAPINYFIRLKMRRACELFDTSAMNVKEAAGALGYDDPFYFSRLFKSVTGVSPNEYRRMPEPFREAVRNGDWPGKVIALTPVERREPAQEPRQINSVL